MRIFALSDLHIDYQENFSWLKRLSAFDYQEDILILSGDVTPLMNLLESAFQLLQKRFLKVIFVPGNHDLWVLNGSTGNSVTKFESVMRAASEHGIAIQPVTEKNVSLVPLFGWYDNSFGDPTDVLRYEWADYVACRWPNMMDSDEITRYFISMNESALNTTNKVIISFSHFVPRIDIMPDFIPMYQRRLYPVLGSLLLEQQIRKLGSHIHVYGHSHVNRYIKKNGVTYINNAFGYPYEKAITSKELLCIYED
jgi:predicted phosphodiesterase